MIKVDDKLLKGYKFIDLFARIGGFRIIWCRVCLFKRVG